MDSKELYKAMMIAESNMITAEIHLRQYSEEFSRLRRQYIKSKKSLKPKAFK